MYVNEQNKKNKTKSRLIPTKHAFCYSVQPTNNAVVSLKDGVTFWRQSQKKDFFPMIYHCLAQHDVCANPFFNKKIKIGRAEHSLTPTPLRLITSHFCLTPTHLTSKWTSYVYHTLYEKQICDALRNLASLLVEYKKHEKKLWRSATFTFPTT